MKFVAYAALGGAIGASGRYLVGLLAVRLLGLGFPYGTFIVNILGALLMGVLIEALALRFQGSVELRTLFATGVLGGFTTFSAFSLEVANMIERDQWSMAAFYACASVVFSVAALFAGLYLGRYIWGASV
ncbi:fluoride efflux transporter CrcB [Hyphomicrobiales bacterium 4NK60-0047b]